MVGTRWGHQLCFLIYKSIHYNFYPPQTSEPSDVRKWCASTSQLRYHNQLFPWNPMKSSSLLVISTIVHWLKLPTALETHPRSAVLAVGSLRVTLQIPVVRAARHKKHGRHHDEIGCIWCDVVSSIFVKTKLTKLSHCWWYPIMTPLYTQYYH